MDIFGDFGFVGAENTTPDRYQDSQTCINWYVEASPNPTSKTALALLGRPGYIQLAAAPGGGSPGNQASAWPQPSSVTNLPVRGMWALPGGLTGLVAIADKLYLATVTAQGSTQTPGSLTLTSVGTLLTTSGPVVMRDNNAGGLVLIVDGPNGYTCNLSGGSFTQITSAQFTSFGGASTAAFIDGWWICSVPGSQTFFTNSPIYQAVFDATYFALKDGASDNLVAVVDNKEELWLIGERTTEIWYNAGGQYFAFQRLAGTLQQFGCKAKYSIARMKAGAEDALIWLGRSERGENIILRTQGFTTQVVSTPAVSDAISSYTITDDAIGYSYEEDGHEFYVLTFPSADKTWVYDSTVPPPFAWTQRASYDPYSDSYHRDRGNCFMNLGGMRIVGDYQNGALYQMTRAAYTDAGWPIKCQRRSPFIWDKETRGRMQMAELQIEFSPGVGNTQVSYPAPVVNNTGYVANAILFSNAPYLAKSDNLAGIASGKSGTFSVWVNALSILDDGKRMEIIDIATSGQRYFSVSARRSGGHINFFVVGENSSGSGILSLNTTANYDSTTQWYNIMGSWNLATGATNLYVNNVSDLTTVTATNDTIDYAHAGASFDIGYSLNTSSSTIVYGGDIAEVFFDTGFVDLSVAANRQLFISANGFPQNLGLTGQNPTGSSPLLYLNNPADTFNTNVGTGGDFVVTGGSLANATTGPSAPAIGSTTIIGSDPQVSLRISRDYGTTYGQPNKVSIGKIGNFLNRCIWRKLGWTRGSVVQIEVIDPVRRDIVGATLKAFGQ